MENVLGKDQASWDQEEKTEGGEWETRKNEEGKRESERMKGIKANRNIC